MLVRLDLLDDEGTLLFARRAQTAGNKYLKVNTESTALRGRMPLQQ